MPLRSILCFFPLFKLLFIGITEIPTSSLKSLRHWITIRVCLHGGGGPQVGEVKRGLRELELLD